MSFRYATKELSINNAKAFIDSVNAEDTTTEKKSTILYSVLGRTEPWENEPNPDLPQDNDQYLRFGAMRSSIGAKKIDPSNISLVTNRYNWVSGTVYNMYRDTDIDMYDRQWYVITDELNVYVCLYNNKDGDSTIKPTGFLTVPFTTSDGYTWKYMYTVSLGDSQKFLTNDYMPVKTLKVSDNTLEQNRQMDVQQSAANGSIEIIEVNSVGSGYLGLANGSVVAASTNTIRIADNVGEQPLTTDNIYNGSSVYIISGTGAGQLRRIVDYDGSTKTLTANTPFQTIANTDSKIVISPTVTIIGDGTNAKAYSRLNQFGELSSITVIDRGTRYTEGKVYITANTIHGFGAQANAIITPIGGHGADPVRELSADKVLLNVRFNDVEGDKNTGRGYIPSNTEFRTVSVIKNPMLKVNSNNFVIAEESIANTSNSPSTLRLTNKFTISYNSMSGDTNLPINPLSVNDTITTSRMYNAAYNGTLSFITDMNTLLVQQNALVNSVRAANANVVFVEDNPSISDSSFYSLYINNVQAYGNYSPFVVDDNIITSDSATEIATITDISGPEANTFSGELLYTENQRPVLRAERQAENIKIILDF